MNFEKYKPCIVLFFAVIVLCAIIHVFHPWAVNLISPEEQSSSLYNNLESYDRCSPNYSREIDVSKEMPYVFPCYTGQKFVKHSGSPVEFNLKNVKISEEDYQLYQKQKLLRNVDHWGNCYWINFVNEKYYLCSKGRDGAKNTEDDIIVECP
jgi:hypothetical protein